MCVSFISLALQQTLDAQEQRPRKCSGILRAAPSFLARLPSFRLNPSPHLGVKCIAPLCPDAHILCVHFFMMHMMGCPLLTGLEK